MPALRYAYFRCVAKGSAREVEDAMRAVVKALGIELVEMPEPLLRRWRHEASQPQAPVDPQRPDLRSGRGHGPRRPDPVCHVSGQHVRGPRAASQRRKVASRDQRRPRATCGMRFEGELRMRHLLQVVVEDVGLDVLRDHVVNPIDFPVAGYYGVPMLQEGAAGDDDPMNPRYFDDLLEAMGSTSVAYDGATRSVGFPACSAESAPPCSKPQKSSLRPSKKAPWSWPPPAPESLQPRRLPGQGEEGLRSRHGPSCGSPSRIDGLRTWLAHRAVCATAHPCPRHGRLIIRASHGELRRPVPFRYPLSRPIPQLRRWRWTRLNRRLQPGFRRDWTDALDGLQQGCAAQLGCLAPTLVHATLLVFSFKRQVRGSERPLNVVLCFGA